MKAVETEMFIAEEIEESYAEIGRSLVASAIAQFQDQVSRLDKPDPDELLKLVVAVPVWVTGRLDERDPSLVSEVCCICERGDAGVIICRGQCC